MANDLNPVIDVLREARLIGASDVHIKTKNVCGGPPSWRHSATWP